MNSSSLKSVTVYNFKSYKGKSEITHFYPFTVIIGPNGIGKSNFMDAIAFALGENWQNLRVNNLTELIYCDRSSNKPQKRAANNDNCYVALSISMDDGSTKNFKRTLFANSQRNLFEFNESTVKSDEYIAELESIGIHDFGKNCLVFQKDVQSIMLQNPKARCQFFERMCSSQHLAREYSLVNNQLAKIQAEAKLIFNDLKSVKNELKILSNDKKRVLEFENLEKEERDLKKNQQLFRLYHLEHNLRNLNDTINTKVDEMRALGEKKLESRRILQNLNETTERNRTSTNELEMLISNKEQLLLREQGNLIEYKEKLKWLEKKKNDLVKQCEVLEKRKKNLPHLRQEKEILTSELNNIKKTISQSSHRLSNDQHNEYIRLRLEVENRKSIYSRENQIDNEKCQLEKYQNQIENKSRIKAEISEKINFLTEEHQKVLDALHKANENLESAKESLAEREKLKENLANEINANEKMSLELQKEFEKIVKELKPLTIEKDHLEAEKEKNKIVDEMKKRFHGVFGRLVGLCKPKDPRHKIAFAKIFEDQADYIVTDTFETFEKCYELMKTMKSKSEYFLPMDNIRPKKVFEYLRQLQESEYAYDYLDFPSEIDRAVQFVTNNILICENTEIAKKLSARREIKDKKSLGYTSVTLDGIMFKNTGKISGGNASQLRRISEKFNEENFQNLLLKKEQIAKELKDILKMRCKKSELESLNGEIDSLRKRIQLIEDQIKQETETKNEIRTNLHSLKEEDNKIRNALEELEQKKSNLKATHDIKIEEMNKIKNEVFANFCQSLKLRNIQEFESIEDNYKEKHDKMKKLQNSIDLVNEEIENLKNMDGEIDEFKSHINETQSELNTIKQKKLSIEVTVKKLSDEIKNTRNDLQVKRNEIQTTHNESCRDHDNDIRQTSEKIKKIKEEIKKLKSDKLVTRNKMRYVIQQCQSQLINIPLLSGNLNDYLEALDEESEISFEIDYTDLSEDYKLSENESIVDSQFSEKLAQIHSKLKNYNAPTRQVDDMLKETKNRSLKLKRKLHEKNQAIKRLQNTFDDVKTRRRNLFESFLSKIRDNVDSIYKNLMQNDSAQAILISENPEEPYLSGIIFNCIVPGKKFLSMDGLSGGEKTTAAFTLLLAIQKASPAPFVFLDEMDGALDFENVDKVTDYINREQRQFILITHNQALSSKATAVLGISSKGKNVEESCIYSVNLQKYRA